MKIKSLFYLGISKEDSELNKLKKFTLNILLLISICLIILLIIVKTLLKQFEEVSLLSPLLILVFMSLIFNYKKKTNISVIASYLSITGTTLLIFFNENKNIVGAPFSILITSLLAHWYFNSNYLKKTIIINGISLYLLTTYIGLKDKYFEAKEFIPFVIMCYSLLIAYLVINSKFSTLFHSIIENINNEVESKNLLNSEIKKQQKVIEDLKESVILQKDLKHQLILQIKNILNSNNDYSKKDLRLLLLDLNIQIDTENSLVSEIMKLDLGDTLFQEKLTKKHPELTISEIEICTYIRLGLTSIDIANHKNKRTNTINVTKTRIRKKLDTNEKLEIYLKKI